MAFIPIQPPKLHVLCDCDVPFRGTLSFITTMATCPRIRSPDAGRYGRDSVGALFFWDLSASHQVEMNANSGLVHACGKHGPPRGVTDQRCEDPSWARDCSWATPVHVSALATRPPKANCRAGWSSPITESNQTLSISSAKLSRVPLNSPAR